MKYYLSIAILCLLAVVCTTNGVMQKGSRAMSAVTLAPSSDTSSYNQNETSASKIARALSAGPANVTDEATVAEVDARGNLQILRKGTNDFTCMPGNPNVVGQPPVCEDKIAMQWNRDFAEHKPKPTTNVPASNICSQERRSVAIRILTTKQILQSTWVPTG